jgi:hypothetical protein
MATHKPAQEKWSKSRKGGNMKEEDRPLQTSKINKLLLTK